MVNIGTPRQLFWWAGCFRLRQWRNRMGQLLKILARLCTFLILFAAPLLAQTGQPTEWTLRVYPAGGQTPTTTLTVPAAQVSCDQPDTPDPGTPSTNPTFWAWDDPAIAGRDCRFTDQARFDALPDGQYEGTVVATNADGSSPESARVPFVRRRPNPPAAPTGLRFSR
jgi:hypothetical protein